MDNTYFIEYGRAAYMTGLPHRVRQPQRPGPHPTVVLIHGRHGNEDVTWVFSRTFPSDWLVVAPRAIEFDPETPQSGDGWSWLPAETKLWPHLDRFDGAVTALSDFTLALPDAYQADPQAIFYLGFSQGAAVGIAAAAEHPGLVSGIAALVGFAPTLPAATISQKPLQALPIYMAAGVQDNEVPLSVAQSSRDALIEAGADLEYHEYQTGHKLNSQGLRDLSAWWQARAADIK